jgi:hypothetical protein
MRDSPAMAKRQQRVSNLRAYAVIGAEQRLLQIAEEARAIFKAFAELRAPNRGFGARGGGESPFPLGAAVSGRWRPFEWSEAQA